MLHPELVESGLAKVWQMSPLTTDMRLAKFLGKKVRFKRELLTPEFVRQNGTQARDCTFMVREVQKIYSGEMALRGYAIETNDTFGRPLEVDHVEIVD